MSLSQSAIDETLGYTRDQKGHIGQKRRVTTITMEKERNS